MRKRVRREWLWVPVLIAVLALALFGCYSPTGTVQSKQVKSKDSERIKQKKRSRELKKDDRPNFTSWHLDFGLYAFTYEGHLYFWELDGFILHVASCPGVHTLVGP